MRDGKAKQPKYSREERVLLHAGFRRAKVYRGLRVRVNPDSSEYYFYAGNRDPEFHPEHRWAWDFLIRGNYKDLADLGKNAREMIKDWDRRLKEDDSYGGKIHREKYSPTIKIKSVPNSSIFSL